MGFPNLSAPITLAGITLKNRIFSAPTSLAELAGGGRLSESNIEYYKLRAAGGCALVNVGESIVDVKTGQSHPMQIALDSPDVVPSLTMCADAIHSHNAAASIELSHGGALCSPEYLGRNAVGPSSYVDEEGDTIDELNEGEISRLADMFGQAAARAKSCGFDIVMIHGGHGWLLHQFLSPLTNRRTDTFGGNLENRMRFPLMVVERVRTAVGKNIPIEFRMSGDERVAGGYDIQTGIEIARILDGKVDLIHVSAGTNGDDYSSLLMHPGVFQSEGENLWCAAEIKKHIKTPVVTVGGFCDPTLMEQVLADAGADCIALGRALIADPMLPKKIFGGMEKEIIPCIRCGECQSNMFATRNMRCTVNPLIGREKDFFHPLPVRSKKKVLIAGGGPGGMQAAITAHEQGHQVILLEQGPRLGGLLAHGDEIPFKSALRRYRDSRIAKVLSLPIEIRLNTHADREIIAAIQPEVIIAAVGAAPLTLSVPGIDGPQVFLCTDAVSGVLGSRVVIIGGGLVGCEYAIYLAQEGHEVVLLEMREELAADCGWMYRTNLLYQLETARVTIATGLRCTEIRPNGISSADRAGNTHTFAADNILIAVGYRPKTELVESLRGITPEFYVIGDAARPRNMMRAIREGYDAAVDLGL
jgi:2,4-dienoyl-CoA reductase-like NADH-dependent reductase (Old Yellow Enzyme family)/NADPH-dependent 2,4-dienoyl-CoA reductase/sulfur reductase-like enzyme